MKINNKQLASLAKEAQAQGWSITPTKSSHYKWVSPAGNVVITSGTPSDGRAIKNITRDLKIAGFIEVTNKRRR